MIHFVLLVSVLAAVRQASCMPTSIASSQPHSTRSPALRARQSTAIAGVTQQVIGVAPVESGLPDPSRWIGVYTNGFKPARIEGHTKYLTEEGGTQKWIASDSTSLDESVAITSTKDGQTITTSVAAPAASFGVVAAAAGGSAKALDMILTPQVRDKIDPILAKFCKPGATLTKRAGSCNLADVWKEMPTLQDLGISEDSLGGVSEFIKSDEFRELLERLGYEWTEFEALTGTAALQYYLAITASLVVTYEVSSYALPYLMHIDLGTLFESAPRPNPTSDEPPAETTSSCPNPKDNDCGANECKGNQDQKCTTEERKDCECTLTMAWPNVEGSMDDPARSILETVAWVVTNIFDNDVSQLMEIAGLDKDEAAAPNNTCEAIPGSNIGIPPDSATSLAEKWCSLDRSQDREDDMRGDQLDPKQDLKTWTHFTYKHADGDCSQNCTDMFKTAIKTCKHNLCHSVRSCNQANFVSFLRPI
jgi:hypothetical protein